MRSRAGNRRIKTTFSFTVAAFAALAAWPGTGAAPRGTEDAQAFLDVPEIVERELPAPRPPTLDELNRGPLLPLRVPAREGDGLGAGRGHQGVDLFAPIGSSVVAVSNSVVLEAGTDGGRGNYVSLFSMTENYTYNYFHLLEPSPVERYDFVYAGTEVGLLGCTGSCFGPHLHFEVRSGPAPFGPVVDPVPFLDGLKVDPLPFPIPAA